jgi:Dynamin central region
MSPTSIPKSGPPFADIASWTAVLTKPDRIPVGEHDSWLHLLQNEQGHFQHGWYCVKQSDQQQLDNGISWQDARDNEVNFFLSTDPWRRVPSSLKSRLGTQCLTSALGKKLFDLICKRSVFDRIPERKAVPLTVISSGYPTYSLRWKRGSCLSKPISNGFR